MGNGQLVTGNREGWVWIIETGALVCSCSRTWKGMSLAWAELCLPAMVRGKGRMDMSHSHEE